MSDLTENKVLKFNIPREKVSELSHLVKGDDDTFVKFFDGKDFGTIRLYEKMIDNMWAEARDAKDKIIEGYQKASNKEEVKTLVHQIYTVLLDLEHKYHVLQGLEQRYFDISTSKRSEKA